MSKNFKQAITKELIKFSKYDLENKLDELNDFKEMNSSYIIKNETFFNNKNNFKYYFIGDDTFIKPFIKYYNLNYENLNIKYNNTPKVLAFKSMEEEVFNLFIEISELLINGTNINEIYIANTDSSYFSYLRKFESLFKIPLSNILDINLYEIPFINDLMNYSLDDILYVLNNNDLLEEKYDYYINLDKDYFYNSINSFIEIINKYNNNNYNSNLIKEVIKNDLKNKKIIKESNNSVKLISVEEIVSLNSNSNVFILNAKYESFPNIAKNNELLSDDDKNYINYPNSSLINERLNDYYLNIVKSNLIKYISYPKTDKYLKYDPSDIASLYLEENSEEKILLENFNTIYSNNYYKSFFNSNDGKLLTTFTGDFNLKDHDKYFLIKHIKESNIKLTPSSITTYFKIPFIFYLERILKVSRFSESVNLHVGNFFHLLTEVSLVLNYEEKIGRGSEFSRDELFNKKILNYILKKDITDFDLNVYFDEFFDLYFNNINIKDEELKIKTLFFVSKNKDLIIEALSFILDFLNSVEGDELLVEKEVETNNFKGKADLVIVKDNKYSVIDYKTGDRSAFNKEKIFTVIDDLLEDKDVLKLEDIDLLQPIFYAYFLNYLNKELKFNDVSFFSYFKDNIKLNALMSLELNPTFYTKGKNRIIGIEEEEELFKKVDLLISKTFENILESKFNVKILKDIDNKVSLDKSWFSVYEALAFYYVKEDLEDEE